MTLRSQLAYHERTSSPIVDTSGILDEKLKFLLPLLLLPWRVPRKGGLRRQQCWHVFFPGSAISTRYNRLSSWKFHGCPDFARLVSCTFGSGPQLLFVANPGP